MSGCALRALAMLLFRFGEHLACGISSLWITNNSIARSLIRASLLFPWRLGAPTSLHTASSCRHGLTDGAIFHRGSAL